MPRGPLRIAFLGGIPASLGGGGLEIQMGKTADALRSRGHDVFDVAQEQHDRPFDVLHAFGSDTDVWHALQHWRRNPAPLVLSPVLVVRAGAEYAYTVAASRLPWRSLAPRMRREVLGHADFLVALTAHEQRLLKKLAPAVPSTVIGNGVEHLPSAASLVEALGLRSPYALLLGTVSARKRQAETVTGLGTADVQPVVVGGFEGSDNARLAFERAVAGADGIWLGEIQEPSLVRELVRQAHVLVHMSSAEGQSLSVLEALSEGTPVVCSPLPSNVELRDRYPDLIRLCESIEHLSSTVATLEADYRPAPIPTWDNVAADLEVEYRRLTGLA